MRSWGGRATLLSNDPGFVMLHGIELSSGYSQSEATLSTKAPFDAAVSHDAGDVLVDALVEDGLPWDEAEAESVVDHREASTGELRCANQFAADIASRLRLPEGEPARGGETLSDARNFRTFEARQGVGSELEASV